MLALLYRFFEFIKFLFCNPLNRDEEEYYELMNREKIEEQCKLWQKDFHKAKEMMNEGSLTVDLVYDEKVFPSLTQNLRLDLKRQLQQAEDARESWVVLELLRGEIEEKCDLVQRQLKERMKKFGSITEKEIKRVLRSYDFQLKKIDKLQTELEHGIQVGPEILVDNEIHCLTTPRNISAGELKEIFKKLSHPYNGFIVETDFDQLIEDNWPEELKPCGKSRMNWNRALRSFRYWFDQMERIPAFIGTNGEYAAFFIRHCIHKGKPKTIDDLKNNCRENIPVNKSDKEKIDRIMATILQKYET